MPFLLFEVSDADAVTLMRSHEGVTVREVCRGEELTHIDESEIYQAILEDEFTAALKRQYTQKTFEYGTPDLVLSKLGLTIDLKPVVAVQTPPDDDDDSDDDDSVPEPTPLIANSQQ